MVVSRLFNQHTLRLYGRDAFCELRVRDVEAVCMHVSGLPDGQLPKQARSLDEIRAPCL
jgi:hypothetical protein